MPRELQRLLKSHEFLRSAIDQHGHRLSRIDVARLTDNLDSVFLEIVEHKSDDPRVTLAQARFLLATLRNSPEKAAEREAIWSACQSHIDRLTLQLSSAVTTASPQPRPSTEYRYLDSLNDRVAIFDGEYRYVFTNRAHGAFHDEDPARFVGRPSWEVTGDRFFQLRNKERFDACLRGETFSCFQRHPGNRSVRLFWATYEPVRNAAGAVESVLVCSRDVSHLPIPPDLVTPNP